jgi:RHS repeat-associated protein
MRTKALSRDTCSLQCFAAPLGSQRSTIYIFSGSKVIGEYAPSAQPSSPTTEYIYAGANLVASIAGATPTYYHPDQLSDRAPTHSTGSVVGQQGHYPFGESWYASGTATKWKFTSYERDPESANDYSMARYDVNRLGRFNSPDPLAGSIADPQTLNHYSYALNDPINVIDPSGMSPNCLIDSHGNCIGGSGGSCTVDGQSVDCGTAMNLLQMGGAAQCPGNDCGAIAGVNGWLYQIILTNEDGFEYVNPLSGNLFISDGSELPLLGDPDDDFSFDGAMPQAQSPNGGSSWHKNPCITGAIASGALHLAVDSIGLIPEAGGLARVIGHQAGYVGAVADQAGSNIIKAVGASTSTGSGLTGLSDTSPEGLLSTGLTIAGFIPGVGQAAAGLSIALDIYKTAKAIIHCK